MKKEEGTEEVFEVKVIIKPEAEKHLDQEQINTENKEEEKKEEEEDEENIYEEKVQILETKEYEAKELEKRYIVFYGTQFFFFDYIEKKWDVGDLI